MTIFIFKNGLDGNACAGENSGERSNAVERSLQRHEHGGLPLKEGAQISDFEPRFKPLPVRRDAPDRAAWRGVQAPRPPTAMRKASAHPQPPSPRLRSRDRAGRRKLLLTRRRNTH